MCGRSNAIYEEASIAATAIMHDLVVLTLESIEGNPPRRVLALVLEWAQEHRVELMEDWELCPRKQTPKTIAPLS